MEPSLAVAATHSLSFAPQRCASQRAHCAPHAWRCPPTLRAAPQFHHGRHIDTREDRPRAGTIGADQLREFGQYARVDFFKYG